MELVQSFVNFVAAKLRLLPLATASNVIDKLNRTLLDELPPTSNTSAMAVPVPVPVAGPSNVDSVNIWLRECNEAETMAESN